MDLDGLMSPASMGALFEYLAKNKATLGGFINLISN